MTATRAVVVTGTSTGIGRATALLLDREGFTVFAGVRTAADGKDLASSASDRLVPVLLDVAKPHEIDDAVRLVTEKLGTDGLLGLVNNAGIAVAAPLEYLPRAEFRLQLEINLIGQLAVTQGFLPLLRRSKGRIVNVTSVGGLIAGPMLGAYHASKFGFEALTDTLRIELAPWGIQVIAIEPGQIATPIWSTADAKSSEMLSGALGAATERYRDRIAASRASVAAAAKDGLPPGKVAEVIVRALTSAHPRTRYRVGIDAKVVAAILARLPDRLRDRLVFPARRRSGSRA